LFNDKNPTISRTVERGGGNIENGTDLIEEKRGSTFIVPKKNETDKRKGRRSREKNAYSPFKQGGAGTKPRNKRGKEKSALTWGRGTGQSEENDT